MMSGVDLLVVVPALVVLAVCWVVSERLARAGKAIRASSSTVARAAPAEREAIKTAFETAHASRSVEGRKAEHGA